MQLDTDAHDRRGGRERAAHRRVIRQRLIALVLAAATLVGIVLVTPSTPPPPTLLTAVGSGPGHLAAGSPDALPAKILIADRGNNRLVVITPRGQVAWSTKTLAPTDVYLGPHKDSIAVTQRGAFVVLTLDVATGALEYVYGKAGQPGAAYNRLRNPQAAHLIANGRLVVADDANCRVLVLAPPSTRPAQVLGQAGDCAHDPPSRLSYPDAIFPTLGGKFVVTESSGWIDLLTSGFALFRALPVHAFSDPFDANEYAAGKLIVTSRSYVGAVEELSTTGAVLWRYGPASGPGRLRDPSLAQGLPDGDVLVCDSGNDRIVVIDRQTKAIVWQYGHTGVPGSRPGYLDAPDSATLVP